MGFTICIKKLCADAIVPERHSEYAAGFDLHCVEGGSIPPGMTAVISTGISIEMPLDKKMYGQIFSRSGMAARHSVMAMGGVIDADYRGEIKVILHNLGTQEYVYEKGARVAQFVPLQLMDVEGFVLVRDINNTNRGENRFGSTGC